MELKEQNLSVFRKSLEKHFTPIVAINLLI